MQVLAEVCMYEECRHNPRVKNVFNVKLRNTENPMDVKRERRFKRILGIKNRE
jgi:hypothetical protein